MKILVIRGANLTSLDGPFVVDLDGGPLGRTGLYAITGPTGAGKTTLLDAMCAALFGCTPRLSNRGGVKVGREDDAQEALGANDVAHLVRRGADHGWAEVDFRGDDGRRYQARWDLRRTASGRSFRQVERRLLELDSGVVLGRTNTEIQAEIEARLGLSEEQFRRTVLLAQGEFAAFLRSNKNERTATLEKLTGYDIYRRVSRRVFDLKREGTLRIKALRDELERDRRGRRSDEERAALEAERAQLAGSRASAEVAREAAGDAVRWHEEQDARLAEASACAAAREAAERAWADAGELRDELQAVEAVAGLRPQVVALDLARVAAEDAAREGDRQEQAAIAAEHAASRAAAARVEAEEALRAAQARREETAPRIARARALDAELAVASAVAEGATRHAEDRRRAARAAGETLAAREGEQAEAARQRVAEASWCEAHAALGPLAAAWGGLEVRLGSLLERRVTLEDRARASQKAAEDLDEARAALTTHEAALVTASAVLAGAGTRREAAEEAVRQAPLGRARARLEQARDDLANAEQRGALLERAFTLVGDADRGQAEADRLRAEAERADADRGAAQARRQELAARLHELRDQLRLVEAAAGHALARAELREGEPCPLCGATAHPWARGTPIDGLVEATRGRVATLEVEEREALTRGTAAESAAKDRRERAAAESERAARAELELGRVAERLGLALSPEPTPVEPLPPLLRALRGDAAGEARGALLTRLRDDALLRVEDLRRVLGAAQSAVEEADRAREALDLAVVAAEAARRSHDEARTREHDARARWSLRTATAEAATRAALEAERAWEADRDAITPTLGGWPGWPAIDRAWIERLREQVGAWRARERRREELERQIEAGASGIQELSRQVLALAAEAEAAESTAKLRVAAHGSLSRDRAACLAGSADAAEATLRHELDAASTAAQQARDTEATARAQAVAARTRAGDARQAAGSAAERADAALAALDAARGARSEAEIRRLLGRDAAWSDRGRAELARLNDARVKAASLLDASQARLAAHAAARPESTTLAEARARWAEAEARLRALQERDHRVALSIAEDDALRARLTERETELAARDQEQLRRDQLARLIGSADGTMFAEFAQGLTLQLLLGHSNRHLEDLNPRYQLERVPGQNMELQVVDRCMADEVRPVTSLSGGETFLVSLALALGLSELVTGRTRVESVFIDEGFGALDNNALDVAIATLEALQGTGRQVGIISHVGGLSERIGAQVKVTPLGSDRRRVDVVAR